MKAQWDIANADGMGTSFYRLSTMEGVEIARITRIGRGEFECEVYARRIGMYRTLDTAMKACESVVKRLATVSNL
jgi:hypothetical protein